MRSNVLLVFVALIAISTSVKASFCSIKCDALFYGARQLLATPLYSIIPGTMNLLNRFGLRNGNAKHSDCMEKCGENKVDVCKNHCDLTFNVSKLAYKVAPSGLVQVGEKFGYGVREEDYQRCITTCKEI